MMTNNNGRGANILDGSSKGWWGGYAGSNQQSLNELSNERIQYEAVTDWYSYIDQDEHPDERNDYIDVNNSNNERVGSIGTQSSSAGFSGWQGASNFDRLMRRGNGWGEDEYDDDDDDYNMMRGWREREWI